jgi:hypothetical protein
MSEAAGRFPATRHSVVRAAQSADPDVRRLGFEALIAAYWKPVYKYVRVKWQVADEDARDLTQDFFARTVEKGFFDRYDPARGRFRTWLRACLDGHVANARKAGQRLKRGGGVSIVPLEFETAAGELRRHDVADTTDLDAYFEREFLRSLMDLAIARVRERAAAGDRSRAFPIFERYAVHAIDGPAVADGPGASCATRRSTCCVACAAATRNSATRPRRCSAAARSIDDPPSCAAAPPTVALAWSATRRRPRTVTADCHCRLRLPTELLTDDRRLTTDD